MVSVRDQTCTEKADSQLCSEKQKSAKAFQDENMLMDVLRVNF